MASLLAHRYTLRPGPTLRSRVHATALQDNLIKPSSLTHPDFSSFTLTFFDRLTAAATMASEDSHSQNSGHDEKSRRASVALAPGDAAVPPAFGASAHDATPTYALPYESDVIPEQDEGVSKIEALYLVFSGWKIWMLYISIGVMCYVTSLSGNTTYVYEGFATSSYGSHSLIGTIATAVAIIGGVAKPFIAKISDVTSRPTAIALCLGFYILGYIVIASSNTVNAVACGQVLAAVGNTGLDIMTIVLVGDITSLQWRGLAQGICASPYIINAFVSGYITDAVTADGWRWGYGMFTIIMPAAIAPLLCVLFWADIKAKRVGALSLTSSSYARRQQLAGERKKTVLQMLLYYIKVIDALGLLLLGFGFALILLPLTLYTKVADNWKNPSIIAMFVCGGVILVLFAVWEQFFSPHPIMPKRLWNRTMWCCIAIDFLYYLSGYISGGYTGSWVYVVKYEWSLRDYTFWSNTLGVSLTVFGLVAGALQRVFHNYKYIQLSGLCIRIIGMGLTFYASQGHTTTAVFVCSQLVIGIGGAMSVIGSQVAVQASVPHQDMALASALLALWTSVGGAIGNAIAAAMWNDRLPKALNKHLGSTYNSTELADIFGSIVVAQAAEPKDLVEQAYNETVWLMNLIGLILAILPLIAGLYTTNFYLGNSQNAIEQDKLVIARLHGESDDDFLARQIRNKEQQHAPVTDDKIAA